MPGRIRIGLAGVGSMGRNHLRVISGHPETILAAVGDPDEAALAAASAQTGAAGFADPLTMVREADVDAIVVAAPTTTHPALAHAAIARGLPVLVEKPLAATTEEAKAIVDAARSAGVPVQVGHVERYNPAVLRLGELLREGWLTTIYAIMSRRAGPFPARIRDVGVTVDLGTHDADMLSWIARERPSRVYAELAQRKHATREDLLFGLLHFPSGVRGVLDVNWLTPAKRRELTVIGEEGMFELDYLTQRLTFTKSDLAKQRADRRLCADLRRRRRGDPGRDARAAQGAARCVRPRDPDRRAPVRRRRGRPLGGHDRQRAPAGPRQTGVPEDLTSMWDPT